MRRLVSLAVFLAATTVLASSVSVELVDEHSNRLATYSKDGQTFILGTKGQRYFIRLQNHTGRRQEVVVSVDGRDVLDGQPADFHKRGYLVDPYGSVTIDGFRLSQASVAAFRFSSVPQSYAAKMGDARDVGAIGVAVFAEKQVYVPRVRRPYPTRMPSSESRAESGMAQAPSAMDLAPAESLAPSAPSAGRSAKATSRPGLGTEFGEEHESYVSTVSFTRQNSQPDSMLIVRYNDRRGLLAL